VPLSEHEERVLRQIERELQRERGLARPLRVPESPEEASRNLRLAAAGFVVGLALLVISFASSWVVGLMGFLVMVACAVTVVQSSRRLLQERLERGGGAQAAGTQGEGGGEARRRWWHWAAGAWSADQEDEEI
jgi:hypothetical protein